MDQSVNPDILCSSCAAPRTTSTSSQQSHVVTVTPSEHDQQLIKKQKVHMILDTETASMTTHARPFL